MTKIRHDLDRPRRGHYVAKAALMGILASSLISAPTSTGAWFTDAKNLTSNSIAAATLQPVTGLTASKTSTGVNVSWNSALQQTWATTNTVTAEPTYSVTRTIDGATPTVISTGTNLTVKDAYGKSIRIKPVVFDAGTSVSGYIKPDGTLMMWGTSTYYALGRTSQKSSSYPVAADIPSGNPISYMTLNGQAGAAVSSTGKLFTWGYGYHGGSNCDAYGPPDTVQLPNGLTPVAASPAGIGCTLIVLDSNGQLWQRGGSVGGSSTAFFKVDLPGGRVAQQLTKNQTVLASDGTVWSWGSNANGQFGNGTTTNSVTPVQATFPQGTVVSSISVDPYNNTYIALANNGNDIYSWGGNGDGQLGLGTVGGNNILTPTRMKLPNYAPFIAAQTSNGTTVVVSSNSKYQFSVGNGNNGRRGDGVVNSGSTGTLGEMKNPNGYDADMLVLGRGQGYMLDKSTNYLQGWGIATDSSDGTALLGNNNNTVNIQPSLTSVANNFTPLSDALRSFCATGTSANGDGYCAPSGVAEYAVSYSFGSWMSSTAKATAK